VGSEKSLSDSSNKDSDSNSSDIDSSNNDSSDNDNSDNNSSDNDSSSNSNNNEEEFQDNSIVEFDIEEAYAQPDTPHNRKIKDGATPMTEDRGPPPLGMGVTPEHESDLGDTL